MQATSSPQPPIILIVIVLSVWGAVRDRIYKKSGGVSPDRFEKTTLLIIIGVSILALAGIYFRSPGAAGTLTAILQRLFLDFGNSTAGKSERGIQSGGFHAAEI